MKIVNVHKAKTELSKLLTEVERGEGIGLARHGKPVAPAVPFEEPKKKRMPGRWKGRFTVPESALQPLLPEDLGYWDERPPIGGFSE